MVVDAEDMKEHETKAGPKMIWDPRKSERAGTFFYSGVLRKLYLCIVYISCILKNVNFIFSLLC